MPYLVGYEGTQLYFEDWGRGRPLVFIPGHMSPHDVFVEQPYGLGRRFRVVVYDRRGTGLSAKEGTDFSIDSNVADLRAVIAGLELKGAVLVGWSMGGILALRYLERYGARGVGGLVLVGSGPRTWAGPNNEYPLANSLAQLGELSGEIHGPLAYLEVIANLGRAFTHRPLPEEVRAWLVGALLRTPAFVRAKENTEVGRADMREFLTHVNVPALVLHGAHDRIMPHAMGQDLARHVPGAHLVTFQESGHMPFLEEPVRFNEELTEFVAGLGGTDERHR
ncbi:MAG: alpha/beta hydrolase [Actinomycetota bacterium]